MIRTEYMKEIAIAEGFELNEIELKKLDSYAEILIEWNQKVNLTAITDPEEIAVKHFLDSFLLLKCVSIPLGASIIDIGTGAGFPSMPCKIIREDLNITLLDSLNKRILFLKELSNRLHYSVTCIHGRAEDLGNTVNYREKYDFATARAVAHLRELAEYTLPYVKPGGYFIALKGYEIEDELKESQKAIHIMGGKVIEIKKFILPNDSKRGIVIIKKISQTPTKYPRQAAKMKKCPII